MRKRGSARGHQDRRRSSEIYDQAKESGDDDLSGCRLVNPLCPDDLCVLPHNHGGYHMLATMYEPMPVSDWMFMWDGGPCTKGMLKSAGAARQAEMIAEEERSRR